MKTETVRVADAACPTCSKTAPVIEHRYASSGAFGIATGSWKISTVTMIDREIHCPGHLSITRTVTRS